MFKLAAFWAAATLTSCGTPAVPQAVKPPCPTSVIEARYDEPTECDVHEGQILVVVLPEPTDAWLAECDDLGGLVWLHREETLCVDVDF